MAEDKVSTATEASKPTRRRASRAAGPAAGDAATVSTGVSVEAPKAVKVKMSRPGPPPRRQAHRKLVAIISLATAFVAAAAMAGVIVLMFDQKRTGEAGEARDQAFADTASQTVVNMFSYTQNNIDDSVNRFVNGTSGPLRDMMSQRNNVENLKALFRDTNATPRPSSTVSRLRRSTRRQERRRAGLGAGDGDRHQGSTNRLSPIGCGSSCTRTTTAT